MNINKLIFIACSFVLTIALLIVVGNIAIKSSIEGKVSKVFGLPAEVGNFESGYLLKLKGLKIKNPEGFEADTMLNISDMTIDKNLGLVEVNVKELLVEKSPTGRVNIDYLKPDTSAFGDLKVRKFNMHLEKVTFRDDKTDKEKVYDVKLNKQYSNLPNAGSLATIIVSEGVNNTNLPDQEGINPPGQILPPGTDIPPATTPPPPGSSPTTTPPPPGSSPTTTPPPGQEPGPTKPPTPNWGGGWDQ